MLQRQATPTPDPPANIVIFTFLLPNLAGQPLEYFYRHLYLPEQGMFKVLPKDFGKDLGQYRQETAAPVVLAMTEKKVAGQKTQKGFIKDGVAYQ